jgi:hypothetical protein
MSKYRRFSDALHSKGWIRVVNYNRNDEGYTIYQKGGKLAILYSDSSDTKLFLANVELSIDGAEGPLLS